MKYIITAIKSILDNAKLLAIEVTLKTTNTNEIHSVTLTYNEHIGIFSNMDWENNGLASIVIQKGFNMKPLEIPINGSIIGLEINIVQLIKDLPEGTDTKSFTDLAKHICINHQIELTPALAFATGFALDNYTPIKGDVCKTCKFKRKCYWYKQS